MPTEQEIRKFVESLELPYWKEDQQLEDFAKECAVQAITAYLKACLWGYR